MATFSNRFINAGSALIFAFAALLVPSTVLAEEGRVISIFEPVEPLDWDENGRASVRIWEPSVRFELDRQSESNLSAIENLVDRATTEGWHVALRFNALAGRFDEYGPEFVYPLCSITLSEERAGSDAGCLTDTATDISPTGEGLIALGLALGRGDDWEEAKELLDRGLEQRDLHPEAVFLAYRARGQTLMGLASRYPVAGPESDQFLIEAADDFRESFDVSRDRTILSLAFALEGLGAYDEALKLYSALPDSSPNAILHRSTRRSYALRALGRLDEALEELRQIGSQGEVAQSMRYAMFLATTLIAMERYEEAVSALNVGMLSQPDFANAFFYRSCAHAALGNIDEALADQRNGYRFFLNYPDVVSVRADENLQNAEMRLALLERLAVETPAQPAPEICEIWPDQFRSRSPLLDELSLDLDALLNP